MPFFWMRIRIYRLKSLIWIHDLDPTDELDLDPDLDLPTDELVRILDLDQDILGRRMGREGERERERICRLRKFIWTGSGSGSVG